MNERYREDKGWDDKKVDQIFTRAQKALNDLKFFRLMLDMRYNNYEQNKTL